MRDKFQLRGGQVALILAPADVPKGQVVWAKGSGTLAHLVHAPHSGLIPLCHNARPFRGEWHVGVTTLRGCARCSKMLEENNTRHVAPVRVSRGPMNELQRYLATFTVSDEEVDEILDEDQMVDEDEGDDVNYTLTPAAEAAFGIRGLAKLHAEPERFLAPFIPATRPDTVVCVGCGRREHAETKISSYPDRYIPHRWSVDGVNQALRCVPCTSHVAASRERTLDFWQRNAVLFTTHPGELITVERPPPSPDPTPELLQKIVTLLQEQGKEKIAVSTTEPQAPEPTLKNKAMDQARDLGGAVMGAGQMILVNQSSEISLRMARKLASKGGPFGEWIAPLLEDEDGREVAKGIMAILLHSVGTYAPLPKGGSALRKIGHIQMQTSAFILGNKYMGVILQEMGELIALGDQLSDAFDTGPKRLDQLGTETGEPASFQKADERIPEAR